MYLRLAIAAALIVPLAPVVSQSIRDTHTEIAMPAGKTLKLFRMNSRNDCAPAGHRHHQAGKGQLATPDAAARCLTETASREETTRARD